ncbi:MAG: hypothetical protein AAF497_26865 [Planctomycetota bacterium]
MIRVPLGIWHDTSLGLAIEWAHGDPQVQPLERQKSGVWSYRASHFRRANYGPGHLYFVAPDWHKQQGFESDQWAEIFIDPKESIESHAIIFESANEFRASWFVGPTSDIGGLAKAGYLEFEPSNTLTRVTHIELPNRSWRWLEIPTLTDMPNPRNIDNLFDVRIPRTVTRDPIYIAARAVEMDVRIAAPWRATTTEQYWSLRYRSNLPYLDLTNENVKPRTDCTANELLLQFAPHLFEMRVDGFDVVVGPKEDPWWEHARNWLTEKSSF